MQRILTSLTLTLLVLLAVFLLPGRWFLLFLLTLGELGALELARIGRAWAPDAPLRAILVLLPVLALLLVGCLTVTEPTHGTELLLATTLLLGPATAAVVLFSRTPVAQAVPALGCLSFGSLYLALPVVSCWRLQQTDPWLLVLLLLMVAGNDTAAFYFGRAFGRRKMSPLVSPNKTWIGAVAGFTAAVGATALWSWWRSGLVAPGWLALGTAVAVAAQCGDLAESMLKRGAGVKDSGRLLPGHGGILDRADSFLFASPVLLLGLLLMARLGLETGP
jgi:phosphatidate cytidylyltransferase